MNQFLLQHGHCRELVTFPHILEIGNRKNVSIKFNALHESVADHIRIYYILDGKFRWKIQGEEVMLYPGDAALVLPGQEFGSETGILEIGTLCWLHLDIVEDEHGSLQLGKWSNLTVSERLTISKILMLNRPVVLSKFGDAARILCCLQSELFNHEIGFCTRINQMLDELLIVTTRHLTKQR